MSDWHVTFRMRGWPEQKEMYKFDSLAKAVEHVGRYDERINPYMEAVLIRKVETLSDDPESSPYVLNRDA